jgi:hypothetical protein
MVNDITRVVAHKGRIFIVIKIIPIIPAIREETTERIIFVEADAILNENSF